MIEKKIESHFKKNEINKSFLVVGKETHTTKTISFVIPTYNRLDTLVEAVKSITELDKLDSIDYEIIIVDNYADTKTNKSVLYFKKNPVKNLKYYINQINLGMEGNWNRCIELSSGVYISMLHDDDLLDRSYIIQIQKCLQKTANQCRKMGFIKTNAIVFTNPEKLPPVKINDKPTLRRIFLSDIIYEGVGFTQTPTCGILFLREALLAAGGFDESLHPSADQIIGGKITLAGYRGYITKDVIGYYRIGINESTKKETIIKINQQDEKIRQYYFSINYLSKIYGRFFSCYKYSNHIDFLVKNYNTLFGMSLVPKDLDYKGEYRQYKFLKIVDTIIIKTTSLVKRLYRFI